MNNSVVTSLVKAIREEFDETLCGEEVLISSDEVISFFVEIDNGRLGFSVAFSQNEYYHTVETDVAFLSSDEQTTYYTCSELDAGSILTINTLQGKIGWGKLVFVDKDASVLPVLSRTDLLPAATIMQESDIHWIVSVLTFMCSEGISLLPSIEALSVGNSLTEQDIETDFRKQHVTLQ